MSDKTIPVRVSVRIRPISEKEVAEGCQKVVQVVDGRPQVFLDSLDKAFTYDYAFDHATEQLQVYDDSVKEMIGKLFSGYNVTVLAYGQTGSGKTHTMGTAYNSETTDPRTAGIIPRAVGDIFEECASRADEVDVSVRVAFVELYKEQLFDLLSPRAANHKDDCALDIREDPVKGVCVPGLTELEVGSLESTMLHLEAGSVNRVTAATAMNKTSSRSHAIFTLVLNMVSKEDPSNVTVAKFHLVDLAGSERQKKTKAEGKRLNEGISINQGLLALGNVISALGEGGKTHVPYRNSKLTRMLQDSLGGNSYTLMIACVSPADSNVEETLSTLRYADRARKIKNKPIVNMNSNDAEMNRLRLENHELKLQLKAGGGGGSFGAISSEESDKLKDLNRKLVKENTELTAALVSSQQDLAHMNEKVLMNESNNEELKTRLRELVAEVDAMLGDERESNKELAAFKKKVSELVEVQAKGERTLMEHEINRNNVSVENAGAGAHNDTVEEMGGTAAEHALKQNALNTQLLDLNKLLAQKEELASTMFANDAKFQEMKKKYEESLKTLESELTTAQKEKDQLMQHHKAEKATEASGKIAEQRRKRIQDLEHTISDLKKKMVEQQRAIKLNEKNAAQVKKLAEEIRGIKAQKVKLIKQMREDAERVRVWKVAKEKEVQQLRQQERKQAVKMTKMENLHSKQQNVLRRKMEEAVAVNKRLKEVMEKQSRAKLGKGPAGAGGNTTLAGAGERVRNWLNEEMDVVVTVKEATNSRGQLIKDRKMLTQQLNDYRRRMRETASEQEMEDMRKAMEELQSDLDLRNAQISALQKQITDMENDSNNSHHLTAAASKVRFDGIRTMTEARIAMEHLFEKMVEQTMGSKEIKSEFAELKHLYDEAVKNTNALEEEIDSMKKEFANEKTQLAREHEERVLVLLSSNLGAGGGSSSSEVNKIYQAELNQFSKLHEELRKMGDENERLRRQQQGSKRASPESGKAAAPAPKKRKSPAGAAERYTAEELLEDDSDESDEDDDSEEDDEDPDWRQTPLFKRIKKLKESNLTMLAKRRKFSPDGDVEPGSGNASADESAFAKPATTKRSSGANGGKGCSCKTGCNSKRCSCRANGPACDERCKCNATLCTNKAGAEKRSPFADITNDSNSSMGTGNASDNDTANTASLLEETYTMPVAPILKVSAAAPVKDPERRNSYFPSPISSSAQEKKASTVLSPPRNVFRSPIGE